jgi:hypothetical protein
MSESDKTLPRRTIAVTLAGVLLLLPAGACALIAALFATPGHTQSAVLSGASLIAAAIFGYSGLAIILRWRGWRIWAGTISWGLIAIFVFSLFALFAPPAPSSTDSSFGLVARPIILAFAVFVLIAKRRERRPDVPAVFR